MTDIRNKNKPFKSKKELEQNHYSLIIKQFKSQRENEALIIDSILRFSNHSNVAQLITEIEGFVEHCCKQIKTSQLRNIYDRLVRIETPNEIQLLRPKIAYVAARQDNPESKAVVSFFNNIIKEIGQGKEKEISDIELQSFKMFFEAVVGYHKFYHHKE